MNGPLEGLVVLDLSRLLPGPYCSLVLADLGAEVIKVEDPQGGDYIRWMLPKCGEYSIHYMLLNRNKKSVTLNLKSPEGVEILKKMAARADVLLESFRPGVLDRLGVGYEELSKINPGLIFCAISGYGADGPYRDRAGHDINYLSIAGMVHMIGRAGQVPAPLPVQIADLAGGSLFGAIGILAALAARTKTGKGCFVDSSMTDGAAALGIMNYGTLWGEKKEPERGEERLGGGLACYDVYETADGRLIGLGALEPKFFASFCSAVQRPDLLIRQFDSGEKRDRLRAEIAEIFRGKTLADWKQFLAGCDFCCEPANTLSEACEDPQLKARGMFFELDDPKAGKVRQVATPFKLSGLGPAPANPPPALGEHTAEILRELGYSTEDIEKLKEVKAV